MILWIGYAHGAYIAPLQSFISIYTRLFGTYPINQKHAIFRSQARFTTTIIIKKRKAVSVKAYVFMDIDMPRMEGNHLSIQMGERAKKKKLIMPCTIS